MQCVSFDLNCFVVVFNMFGAIVIGFDRFCVFYQFDVCLRFFVTFRMCSVKFANKIQTWIELCVFACVLYFGLVSQVCFRKAAGFQETMTVLQNNDHFTHFVAEFAKSGNFEYVGLFPGIPRDSPGFPGIPRDPPPGFPGIPRDSPGVPPGQNQCPKRENMTNDRKCKHMLKTLEK